MGKTITVTTLLIVTTLAGSIVLARFGQVNDLMRERILSKDFKIAQEALEENRKQKNVQAVCLSLKHQTLIIRRQAADALREIRDKGSVNCLIEALKDNQVVYLGGSETTGLQGELNESIVAALRAITGLGLPVKANFTAAEMKQITSKIERWLSANKRKVR